MNMIQRSPVGWYVSDKAVLHRWVRCIIHGVCTVVEDFSSGRLSNKYWALWVETLRPVMSKINHHPASTGRGSAEINQAEKAHRERNRVHGHTGVNPPTATWVRTLQEISQNESLTLCCILWVFLLLHSRSLFSFFSVSHCFFICLCPPLPQIKPTNLSLTSLAPMPGPPPLLSPPLFFFPLHFHAFFMMYFSPLAELCLLASWPFLFCQSPPTTAWQIQGRRYSLAQSFGPG